MDDTCTITQDSLGAFDDVLDEETGRLVQPSSDSSVVYDGKCLVGLDVVDGGIDVEGGREYSGQKYRASLPWNADIPVGSVLEVTSSRRDPQLVGMKFNVKAVSYKTMLVSRRLALEPR